MYLLVCFKAVVVLQWHMHSKLVFSPGIRRLTNPIEILNADHALYLLLMHVVDRLGCDNENPLLRPVKHICLFDHVSEQELL